MRPRKGACSCHNGERGGRWTLRVGLHVLLRRPSPPSSSVLWSSPDDPGRQAMGRCGIMHGPTPPPRPPIMAHCGHRVRIAGGCGAPCRRRCRCCSRRRACCEGSPARPAGSTRWSSSSSTQRSRGGGPPVPAAAARGQRRPPRRGGRGRRRQGAARVAGAAASLGSAWNHHWGRVGWSLGRPWQPAVQPHGRSGVCPPHAARPAGTGPEPQPPAPPVQPCHGG